MTTTRRGPVWLAVLLMPLVLSGLNVRLLASTSYLRLAYARPGFPAAPGFDTAERLALSARSTAFIVSDEPAASLAALQHDGAPLYTALEVAHLVDVQQLVRSLGAMAVLGGIALVAVGWLRRRSGDRSWVGRAATSGGWACVALSALAAAGVGLAWSSFFTGFHETLFQPGTWQFPVDSTLIQLYPEVFWRDAATALVGLTVLEGVTLVLLGRRLRP